MNLPVQLREIKAVTVDDDVEFVRNRRVTHRIQSRLMLLAVAALIPALPFCHSKLRAVRPKSDRYPKEINTLGDHIRSGRLDLNLLQRQVAEQIGVKEITITNWERNATTPAIRSIPAIIDFLGYDPRPAAASLPERLVSERRALGLSQRKMAERLGIDPDTIQGWKAGRRQPTRQYLEMVERVL